MFGAMIESLVSTAAPEGSPVKLADYEYWKKLYTFDALQNLRYGQSFCNYFNITDHRIFYESNWTRCDALIRREWLATS